MTKNIYTLFNLIAIAAIIFIGIDTGYRFVEAQLEQPDFKKISVSTPKKISKRIRTQRLQDYEIINRRGIFGKTIKDAGKDIDEVENLDTTSLNISLIGTAAMGDQKTATAVIAVKRKQALYHVGDSVEKALIKKILRGKVVLRVNGKDEILLMEEPTTKTVNLSPSSSRASSPGTRPGPSRTITIKRDDIEQSLSNIQDLVTQASIKPHFTDGEVDGLSVTGVKAGSIFRKMGLRNGDIVKSVNGNDIKSPEDLLSLYSDLQAEDNISIKIIRRGRERTNNLRVR